MPRHVYAPQVFSRAGPAKSSATRKKRGTYNCQPQVQMQAVADCRQLFLQRDAIAQAKHVMQIHPACFRVSSYIRSTHSSGTVSHFSGFVYPSSRAHDGPVFSHGKTRFFLSVRRMDLIVICERGCLVKSPDRSADSWRNCYLRPRRGQQIENCEGNPTAMHDFVATMPPDPTR